MFAKFGSAVSGQCNVRSFDATLGDVSATRSLHSPSTETIVPNAPVGAAPAAMTDQIVLVLVDFRGDVALKLESSARRIWLSLRLDATYPIKHDAELRAKARSIDT